MAVKVEFSFTTPADAAQLVAHMRQADRDEVQASTGDVNSAVVDSVLHSVWCLSLHIDGELACIFGIAPIDGMLGRRAAPWMLGTPVLDRHPRVLMRHCRPYVAHMAACYPHLLNFVDERNTRSKRWLKAMGFTLHPAQPYGVEQRPFHFFEMRR